MSDATVTEHTARLDTIDGLALDGDLAIPASPRAGAVIAHPHPQFGGDRHSPVVSALYAALGRAGVAVVRFDFRGVGASEGSYDEGRGERLDIAAAIELIAGLELPGPVLLAGYSFGAMVAAQVNDPRLSAWLLVAPPLGRFGGEPLAGSDHRRKHVLVAEHDQFCPPAVADATIDGWTSTTSVTIAMADHFFAGALDRIANEAVDFVESLI